MIVKAISGARFRDPGKHLGARLIYDIVVDAERRRRGDDDADRARLPGGAEIARDVAEKVKSVPGVTDAKVEVVWEPAWRRDRMSDAAKLQLGCGGWPLSWKPGS